MERGQRNLEEVRVSDENPGTWMFLFMLMFLPFLIFGLINQSNREKERGQIIQKGKAQGFFGEYYWFQYENGNVVYSDEIGTFLRTEVKYVPTYTFKEQE